MCVANVIMWWWCDNNDNDDDDESELWWRDELHGVVTSLFWRALDDRQQHQHNNTSMMIKLLMLLTSYESHRHHHHHHHNADTPLSSSIYYDTLADHSLTHCPLTLCMESDALHYFTVHNEHSSLALSFSANTWERKLLEKVSIGDALPLEAARWTTLFGFNYEAHNGPE